MKGAGIVACETDGLRVALLAQADAPLVASLYADAEVMRWIGPVVPTDVGSRIAHRMSAHNLRAAPGHRFWTLQCSKQRDLIGLMSLRRNERIGELGVMLAPAWCNRGLGRHAFAAGAALCFSEGSALDAVEVRRPDDPQAARLERVVRPLGFQRIAATAGTRAWGLAYDAWREGIGPPLVLRTYAR